MADVDGGFADNVKFTADRDTLGNLSNISRILPYRSPFAVKIENSIIKLKVKKSDDDNLYEVAFFKLLTDGTLQLVEIMDSYLITSPAQYDLPIPPMTNVNKVIVGSVADTDDMFVKKFNGRPTNLKTLNNTVFQNSVADAQRLDDLEDGIYVLCVKSDFLKAGEVSPTPREGARLFEFDSVGATSSQNDVDIFAVASGGVLRE